MLILFYKCARGGLPMPRFLLKKNLQLSKNPARKVGSLGFALGFELFEVKLMELE